VRKDLIQARLYLDLAPFNHIFSGIGEAFKNLEELYVNHQQIKFVERANFEQLENLERLWIDKNEIEHLPQDVFWDLKNLDYLNLSNNKISELSDKIFKNLKSIESIDLSNNRIKRFPSNLLAANLKLITFKSEGNPGDTKNIDISRIPSVKPSLCKII
jgi:Leucine-rich repeat (LRR) protein